MSMIAELDNFSTFEALLESLKEALINKSIFKWKRPEDFNSLYKTLVKLSSDKEALRVIATLGRVEAALKKPLFDLDEVSRLLVEAPDLEVLKEGDDRYYAAQFLQR